MKSLKRTVPYVLEVGTQPVIEDEAFTKLSICRKCHEHVLVDDNGLCKKCETALAYDFMKDKV